MDITGAPSSGNETGVRELARSLDCILDTELQALAEVKASTTEAWRKRRKAKSEDPIEDISGTFGLSAACDSYWVMRHHEDGAVLHVGGRLWDRDAHEFKLQRGQQRWELIGEFDALTDIQRATLDMLKRSGRQGPTDAAKAWSISRQSAMERLGGLVKTGHAYSKAGVYYAK